jgi:hypothetical protein
MQCVYRSCAPSLRLCGASITRMTKFTEALPTHDERKPARETQQQQLNEPSRHFSAASPAPAEVARARARPKSVLPEIADPVVSGDRTVALIIKGITSSRRSIK